MTTHSNAYTKIAAAYATVLGRRPTECEVAVLAAVSWHETRYGRAWKDEGASSFNMGAITAGTSWKGNTFSYSDSRPEDGHDLVYQTAFRAYESEQDGFEDLVRAVFIWKGRHLAQAAAKNCDILTVSQVLYDTSYYKGRAAQSPNERIRAYASALESAVRQAGILPVAALRVGTNPLAVLVLGLTGFIFYSTVRGRKPERLPHAYNR